MGCGAMGCVSGFDILIEDGMSDESGGDVAAAEPMLFEG